MARNYKRVRIAPELLIGWCTTRDKPLPPTTCDGLSAGCRLLGVKCSGHNVVPSFIDLIVEHPDFPELPEPIGREFLEVPLAKVQFTEVKNSPTEKPDV